MNDTASANRPSGRMSGGRALAEMVRLAGVGPMFGMGGFQLLPVYDAIRQLGLRHHLINDERTGAFAADAYARVTGRPGVCDGTLGPGATNLVTGLVEALNAGPVLVDVPEDVCHSEHEFAAEDFYIDAATVAVPARRARPAREAVEHAAALLAKVQRPLVLA